MRALIIILSLILTMHLSEARDTIILTPENSIYYDFEVNVNTINWAINKIIELEKKHPEKIYLIMNSPGGSVQEGTRFIHFLEQFSNIDTVTYFAASMGSAIVEGNPGKRLIVADGTLMFHRAATSMQGQINDGELESRIAWLKNLIDVLESINYNRMGMSKADYKAAIKDELFLVGQGSVDKNAADAVINVRCSEELMNNLVDIRMNGKLIFRQNGCPMIDYIELVKEDEVH